MSIDTLTSFATTAVLLIVGIVAALGYFRRERHRSAADALDTAEAEIGILKGKVDRLETEAAASREQSARDRAKIQMLTELVTSGNNLSEQIQSLVHAEIGAVIHAIDEGKRDILAALGEAPAA